MIRLSVSLAPSLIQKRELIALYQLSLSWFSKSQDRSIQQKWKILSMIKLLGRAVYRQGSRQLGASNIFGFSDKPPRGFENFKRQQKKTGAVPPKEKQQESATQEPQEEKPIEEEQKQEKPNQEDSFLKDWQEARKNQRENGGGIKPPKLQWVLVNVVSFGGLYLLMNMINWDRELSYTDFQRRFLEGDRIKRITIKQSASSDSSYVALIKVDDGTMVRLIITDPNAFLENLEKNQLSRGKTVDQFIPVKFLDTMHQTITLDKILKIAIVGFTLAFAFTLLKGMKESTKGLFNTGKTFKQYEEKVKVRFADVAGLDEAKVEITEFVEFLKKPTRFKNIGAKIPRGALLTGPPGTGKTMMAKACAGEAGVPFFYVSGSDFVEMFVGVGAGRVRELFQQAKSKAPSIIFIDEIDAVGKKRGSSGRNDERDNTLNQLLVEMDGFGTEASVVILAATNRKDMLDPALTRPGRFDRSIDITLPDIGGRKQIFMVHLKPLKLDPSKSVEEYAKRLATLTPGFSGAQIANICNEAAILAARKGKKVVDSSDFELATERVFRCFGNNQILGGLERTQSMSIEERKTISIHEAGHAVVSWFLEGGHPLLKLTIIPRSKGQLGFSQYLPNESSLQTKEQLMDQIACVLGGRCAEMHFLNRITTGAQDDMQRAASMAYKMVAQLGMSEKIGYMSLVETEYQRAHSDSTVQIIDAEIHRIIEECTAKARSVISEKSELILKLSETLLDKETLDLQGLISILGPRPFEPQSNYRAYLNTKKLDLHSQ